jgi:hypothetical protein
MSKRKLFREINLGKTIIRILRIPDNRQSTKPGYMKRFGSRPAKKKVNHG